MIDEDRTYENEVRLTNDRLGVKKIEKITRAIFHWTWRVQTHRKYKRKK